MGIGRDRRKERGENERERGKGQPAKSEGIEEGSSGCFSG